MEFCRVSGKILSHTFHVRSGFPQPQRSSVFSFKFGQQRSPIYRPSTLLYHFAVLEAPEHGAPCLMFPIITFDLESTRRGWRTTSPSREALFKMPGIFEYGRAGRTSVGT
jgi:hypothetical protein